VGAKPRACLEQLPLQQPWSPALQWLQQRLQLQLWQLWAVLAGDLYADVVDMAVLDNAV